MSEILKKQLLNERKAYEITERFLSENTDFAHYEYSLLWISFNFFMNSNYKINNKKKKLKIELPTKFNKEKYYLIFGKIPQIEEKFHDLQEIKIVFNNKGLNGFYKNKIFFSPIYKKTKIKIDKSEDVHSLFEKFIKIHNNDLNRFEDYLKKIFTKNKPQFILLDEDRTKYKKIIVNIAKHYNIKTFVIQHGITPLKKDNKIPLSNASFTPIYADYFLSWGNNSKRFLINTGNDSNKIIITGNPFLQKIKKYFEKENSILIIDQQFDSQYDERHFAYSQLIETLKENNINFDIYLRKDYNKKYFKTSYSNINIIRWRKEGIFEEILKHKIIIGFNSSAILEAVFLNRPVIVFDYFNKGDDMGFESKMIKIANNMDKLLELIRDLNKIKFEQKDSIESLKEHFTSYGEEAINNIVNTILSYSKK